MWAGRDPVAVKLEDVIRHSGTQGTQLAARVVPTQPRDGSSKVRDRLEEPWDVGNQRQRPPAGERTFQVLAGDGDGARFERD